MNSKIPAMVTAFYNALCLELGDVGPILVTLDPLVGMRLASVLEQHFFSEQHMGKATRQVSADWAAFQFGPVTFRWPLEPIN